MDREMLKNEIKKYDLVIRVALPSETDTLSRLAMKSKAYWPYDEDFLEKCKGRDIVTDLLHNPAHPLGQAFII